MSTQISVASAWTHFKAGKFGHRFLRGWPWDFNVKYARGPTGIGGGNFIEHRLEASDDGHVAERECVDRGA
jgi:hypothetical protein